MNTVYWLTKRVCHLSNKSNFLICKFGDMKNKIARHLLSWLILIILWTLVFKYRVLGAIKIKKCNKSNNSIKKRISMHKINIRTTSSSTLEEKVTDKV